MSNRQSRRFMRLMLACALVALLFASDGSAAAKPAAAGPPAVAIVTPQGRQLAVVNVELAQTDGQRAFGLMYRPHLPEDAGMLFIFQKAQHLTFWMKHTEIPLDMIFADASGTIVGIVANAKPYSLRPLSVIGEAQYVLEVNGGFARRHDLANGDRLHFIGFTPKPKN